MGINWDDFFGKISYRELRERSPQLYKNRHPSAYNQTKSHYYISTLDDYVLTDSITELRSALGQLVDSKNAALMASELDHYKLGILKIDYFEICGILSAIAPDAERYLDPDAMFAANQSE